MLCTYILPAYELHFYFPHSDFRRANLKKFDYNHGMAQWIECQPGKKRVAGSIPSKGKCLGGGPDLQ